MPRLLFAQYVPRRSTSPSPILSIKEMSDSYLIGRECEQVRKILPIRLSHPFIPSILSISLSSHFSSGISHCIASQIGISFCWYQTIQRLWQCLTWSTAGPFKDQRERPRPLATKELVVYLVFDYVVRMLHKITYDLTILKLCGISNPDYSPSGMRWPGSYVVCIRSLYSCFVLINRPMLFDYQSILFLSKMDWSKSSLTVYFMRQALRTMERLNQIRENTKQDMRCNQSRVLPSRSLDSVLHSLD